MNEKELDQLHVLTLEIKEQQRYLQELEDEGICAKDLIDAVRRNLLRSLEQRRRIEEFIEGVEDSEIRLVVRMRHVEGLSWSAIARRLGSVRRGHEPNRTTIMRRYRRYLISKTCKNVET